MGVVRLLAMRHLPVLLLPVVLAGLAGCSGPRAVTAMPTEERPASTPLGGPPGAALQADAAATGKRLLETPGFAWVGDPQPMLAQEMPFADAAGQIPAMSDAEHSPYWPDTAVWLVILKGEWDLMPIGPLGATLVPNRYEGCLMVLFTAADRQVIAAGDTACPGD